ncbi:MAG: hypothetical protein A7316_00175 [Candidatus Altiarchaeales archaeon WOR_SM1_86-2]|nr:MAG: hypothetical protein A7316_00175 [Candidatus Altiarchaeales archaeon WOR_SM1_86-2]
MKKVCKTGIGGKGEVKGKEVDVLDEIIGGGIPEGHTVLLAGSSGTGKTILAQEFLFNGTKLKDKGLYVSLSETAERMEKNIEDFRFYDKKLIDAGDITILDIKEIAELKQISFPPKPGLDPNLVLSAIRENIAINGARRVVIDSITALCQNIGDEDKIREFLYELESTLAVLGCTTLLISEIAPQQFIYSRFGIEEYISDGIILLMEHERSGELMRTLQVIKMRGTGHSRTKQAMKITLDGIKLAQLIE